MKKPRGRGRGDGRGSGENGRISIDGNMYEQNFVVILCNTLAHFTQLTYFLGR